MKKQQGIVRFVIHEGLGSVIYQEGGGAWRLLIEIKSDGAIIDYPTHKFK
jgi:hypothetical protein